MTKEEKQIAKLQKENSGLKAEIELLRNPPEVKAVRTSVDIVKNEQVRRTYSLEAHGEDYKKLAEGYAIKRKAKLQ